MEGEYSVSRWSVLMADVFGCEEEVSRNRGRTVPYIVHGDEDGPQEDNPKRRAIGQPEDKKKTCEDM
jgi:hypothetical protein